VTRDQIDEALRLHRLWLEGRAEGRRADLSRADLRRADLSGADLRDAELRRADLSGAELRDADLRRADLRGAVLRRVDLSGADLSGADLPQAPVVERLHERLSEAVGEQGEHLCMSDWHHRCGTSHCRAGWAIMLAGDDGLALEASHGPATAAVLIYAVSTGMVPDFYATDHDALEDIRRCAAEARRES
jgi:hypothetical protein